MQLSEAERELLRSLYVEWRHPRGHYKRSPSLLAAFTQLWNRLAERADEETQLLRYMDNQQKTKGNSWPVFNGKHRQLPAASASTATLSDEQLKVLRNLYILLVVPEDVGTEGLVYQSEILERLTSAFRDETGQEVNPLVLAAIIEEKRKAGQWVRLCDHRSSDDGDFGFDDLDAIA